MKKLAFLFVFSALLCPAFAGETKKPEPSAKTECAKGDKKCDKKCATKKCDKKCDKECCKKAEAKK